MEARLWFLASSTHTVTHSKTGTVEASCRKEIHTRPRGWRRSFCISSKRRHYHHSVTVYVVYKGTGISILCVVPVLLQSARRAGGCKTESWTTPGRMQANFFPFPFSSFRSSSEFSDRLSSKVSATAAGGGDGLHPYERRLSKGPVRSFRPISRLSSQGSTYRDRDEELDTGRIRPNFQAATDQFKFPLVI